MNETPMIRRKLNPYVKLALEMGPLLLFFAGFRFIKDGNYHILGRDYSGFVVMTAVLVVVIAICSAILRMLTGRLSRMQLMTLVLVVVMGGLTVYLNDDRFIKMKPTLLYLAFGGVLAVGLLRGESYLKLVMDEIMPMHPEGWMILTKRMCAFFLALALANEVIWRFFSTELWVDFKTFGLPAALFAFFMLQGRLLERHGIEVETPENDAD